MAMTKRQMYNAITASTIAEDAEVEFVDGELRVVAPKRPLPPPPSDPDEPRTPALGALSRLGSSA